jgi:hypothetical protein
VEVTPAEIQQAAIYCAASLQVGFRKAHAFAWGLSRELFSPGQTEDIETDREGLRKLIVKALERITVPTTAAEKVAGNLVECFLPGEAAARPNGRGEGDQVPDSSSARTSPGKANGERQPNGVAEDTAQPVELVATVSNSEAGTEKQEPEQRRQNEERNEVSQRRQLEGVGEAGRPGSGGEARVGPIRGTTQRRRQDRGRSRSVPRDGGGRQLGRGREEQRRATSGDRARGDGAGGSRVHRVPLGSGLPERHVAGDAASPGRIPEGQSPGRKRPASSPGQQQDRTQRQHRNRKRAEKHRERRVRLGFSAERTSSRPSGDDAGRREKSGRSRPGGDDAGRRERGSRFRPSGDDSASRRKDSSRSSRRSSDDRRARKDREKRVDRVRGKSSRGVSDATTGDRVQQQRGQHRRSTGSPRRDGNSEASGDSRRSQGRHRNKTSPRATKTNPKRKRGAGEKTDDRRNRRSTSPSHSRPAKRARGC